MGSVHAERLNIELMSRGRQPRLDRFQGLDRTGTAWAVVDAMGRCVDIGLGRRWSSELGAARVPDGLAEALESARMEASVAILAELRDRRATDA
jgi:hypothetical protein